MSPQAPLSKEPTQASHLIVGDQTQLASHERKFARRSVLSYTDCYTTYRLGGRCRQLSTHQSGRLWNCTRLSLLM